MAVIVPLVELPPAVPFTLQVTPRFPGSLLVVAVNCAVPPAGTVELAGLTGETLTLDVTVTVAEEVLVVSACETAVTVT